MTWNSKMALRGMRIGMAPDQANVVNRGEALPKILCSAVKRQAHHMAADFPVGFKSFISVIAGNGIFTISPLGHSILTLGVVSAWVVFMLRTTPRTRCPSVVVISILSFPYSGWRAARALVTSTNNFLPSRINTVLGNDDSALIW